jgi:ribosomal protein S18 acetylase RimI-like enzyme
MEFREISFNSPAYRDQCVLRNEVLRKSLGLDLFEENLEEERDSFHFGMFDNIRLVGCVVVKPLSDTRVQLRQMAVDPGFQGQGLGRKVMEGVKNFL